MNEILLGSLIGLIAGLITSLIALFQSIPIWKKQGFSRARTKKEKQIINNYWKIQNLNNYSWVGVIIILIVGILLWALPFFNIRDPELVVIFACFTWFSFFGFFITYTFLMDNYIRRISKQESSIPK